jgi:hypothetical protein
MPLPVVNQTLELVSRTKLRDALLNHAPVTGDNAHYAAKVGNATWVGNRLVLGAEGLMNYWFLPDEQDKVSACVVHSNGAGEAYVLSQNYGGCEYHELYHAATRQIAFLHVYRGSSGLTPYTIGAGWALRGRIHSRGLALRFGNGPVWSISCIDRTTNPATVTSKFISARGALPPPSNALMSVTLDRQAQVMPAPRQNLTANPTVTITHEDPGTNPG